MGYTGAILLAMCPPVWKKVMNPVIACINKGEKVPDELQQKNKMIVYIYSAIMWTILTYVGFFLLETRPI